MGDPFSEALIALIFHPVESAVIVVALFLIYFFIILYIEKRYVTHKSVRLTRPKDHQDFIVPVPILGSKKIHVTHYDSDGVIVS